MKADREIYSILEDIHYKYERLQALISILQQFTAECVDITGAPENAVSDSLFEIEIGMLEANERLGTILTDAEILRELKSA